MMNEKSMQHFDVLIIGAGLSGIGAACHLSKKCPDKSFAIMEGRGNLGGTWDLFRYPGIRSDSDMYTLGYNFKPWTDNNPIAAGGDIHRYISEAATEHNIESTIRYDQRVVSASWSSEKVLWTLKVKDSSGQVSYYTCGFVLSCTGYYSYEAGYTPEFEGWKEFSGDIIHPQKWPQGYDYSGKKVVVIGSGATAVTIVPAMAEKVAHITMLQRSPSYVMALPMDDPLVNGLRRILPQSWVYRFVRSRNISLSWLIFNFCRVFPNASRKFLVSQVKKQLPEDFDMKHFSPRYAPWDERLCIVPDGDLFEAISSGKASVETGEIERFTSKGIVLKSGEELEADLIVTATGLDLQVFGNMQVSVDGQPYDIAKKMCYRGALYQDLPNLGMIFGYTNASWTLKADLVADYVCRILNFMDENGKTRCTPRDIDNVEQEPFLNMQSGYIQRAKEKIPQQGVKPPWKLRENYMLDFLSFRFGKIDEASLEFLNTVPKPSETKPTANVEESVS